MFNQLLALFGIVGKGWITNPTWALPSVIGLHVWTFGASMVIFLAALRQIPESYYEAASIDGANFWQRFRRITLPLLTPVIFFNMVLLTIGSFQSFTQAFVISNGSGGPVDSTLLYSLYLYYRAFQQLHMGYASAMAWVLLVGIAVVTALIFWSSRYWVFYGDDDRRYDPEALAVRRRRRRRTDLLKRAGLHALLIVLLFFMLYPVIWMVVELVSPRG